MNNADARMVKRLVTVDGGMVTVGVNGAPSYFTYPNDDDQSKKKFHLKLALTENDFRLQRFSPSAVDRSFLQNLDH